MLSFTKDGNAIRVSIKGGKVIWLDAETFRNAFTFDKVAGTVDVEAGKLVVKGVPIAELAIDGVSPSPPYSDAAGLGNLIKYLTEEDTDSAAAFSGSYNDLSDLPDLSQFAQNSDLTNEASARSTGDSNLNSSKEDALGYTPENVANKDTDGTLAANSDTKYASQKAAKTYSDTKLSSSYLDTDGTLAANSDSKVPSQKAVKTYADNLGGGGGTPASLAILAFAELGSSIKAEPVGISLALCALSNASLADGRVDFIPVYLPAAKTITGVMFHQTTQGVYTADNYNGVGLYSYSGGTLTLVASSTDDGNIWKTVSTTWKTKAFSSPYSAAAGLYFVALLYNSSAQTTAPQILKTNSAGSITQFGIDFTNSAKLFGNLAGQNTLPATQAMSGVSGATDSRYVAVY